MVSKALKNALLSNLNSALIISYISAKGDGYVREATLKQTIMHKIYNPALRDQATFLLCLISENTPETRNQHLYRS